MCFSTSHVLTHVSQESYDKFSYANVLMHCSQLMCALVVSRCHVLKSFRSMSFFSRVANAQAAVCVYMHIRLKVSCLLKGVNTQSCLLDRQAMNPMELIIEILWCLKAFLMSSLCALEYNSYVHYMDLCFLMKSEPRQCPNASVSPKLMKIQPPPVESQLKAPSLECSSEIVLMRLRI